MLSTFIIRTTACAVCLAGGTLYAMEAGWIGGQGNAQTHLADETTLASSSRGVTQPGIRHPVAPQVSAGADVRLPMAVEPVTPAAPAALVVPATFDTAPETPGTAGASTAQDLSDLGLPCEISVVATPLPAAMVALDVMAPCRPDAALRVAHAGLTVDARTDAVGLLTLDLPAFQTPATFSVQFEDGIEEIALVGLPDLRDYDRIGLSWQGDLGLELHAMEFGAGFGEAGHVWHEAPSSDLAAIAGEGGFLTVIQSGESHAQIYTLPRSTLSEGDSVQMSIDAPVTEANCAQFVAAQTLRSEAGAPADPTELTFTMPACDAIGDVLVLQNLLGDLRLASN